MLAAGSFVAALLYTMFIVGILGSTPAATPDTVSGLTSWPIWKKEIIAIFGLLAVATIYLPISHEIKNALEKDLGWNGSMSRFLILFVPLVFIGLGLRSFLTVAGIVGGAFIGAQYLLIVAVGRRALMLSAAKNFFLDLIAVVFAAAAVYEVWTFVVH